MSPITKIGAKHDDYVATFQITIKYAEQDDDVVTCPKTTTGAGHDEDVVMFKITTKCAGQNDVSQP